MRLTFTQRLPFGRDRVFAFFTRPAEAVAVAPADAGLSLIDAPESLALGARTVAKMKRWGLSVRIVTEVVALDAPASFSERQVEGPFASWVHERRFASMDDGSTEVTETIDVTPPGGLMGLTLTAARVEAELRRAYEGREARIAARMREAGVTP